MHVRHETRCSMRIIVVVRRRTHKTEERCGPGEGPREASVRKTREQTELKWTVVGRAAVNWTAMVLLVMGEQLPNIHSVSEQ